MTTTPKARWMADRIELSEGLYQAVIPTPVPNPAMAASNPSVAAELGLDSKPAEYLQILSGNLVPEGTHPYSAGYAGHQFGVWVPELGDGRAITLGALESPSRCVWEVQLKGSGKTRWSRMGDGRAVLRSTVREYLASAAMAGLGVPTTTALSIVTSNLPVYREQTESAAILTRVAPSHIRFGSFQWLASLGEIEARDKLADVVITNHFPALEVLPRSERFAAWYDEIVTRTARLMAEWTSIGFAHGVMNTDNFSILGLTLDYGPFGWMDEYDPALVCNHSDWQGRYRFDQQPSVGLWNCARLAEALFPLIDEEHATASLENYRSVYQAESERLIFGKLGLVEREDGDIELATAFLKLLHEQRADYTRSFRSLSHLNDEAAQLGKANLISEIGNREALSRWLERYRERLGRESRPSAERAQAMLGINPKYVLRNWVAQEVIQNAETGNTGRIDEIRALLDRPFDEHDGWERYAEKPPGWAREIVVSCSS